MNEDDIHSRFKKKLKAKTIIGLRVNVRSAESMDFIINNWIEEPTDWINYYSSFVKIGGSNEGNAVKTLGMILGTFEFHGIKILIDWNWERNSELESIIDHHCKMLKKQHEEQKPHGVAKTTPKKAISKKNASKPYQETVDKIWNDLVPSIRGKLKDIARELKMSNSFTATDRINDMGLHELAWEGNNFTIKVFLSEEKILSNEPNKNGLNIRIVGEDHLKGENIFDEEPFLFTSRYWTSKVADLEKRVGWINPARYATITMNSLTGRGYAIPNAPANVATTSIHDSIVIKELASSKKYYTIYYPAKRGSGKLYPTNLVVDSRTAKVGIMEFLEHLRTMEPKTVYYNEKTGMAFITSLSTNVFEKPKMATKIKDLVKIGHASKKVAKNKAKNDKFVKLTRITDNDDALNWLAAYSGTDIEDLEEQQESEGQEDDPEYIKKQLTSTMKNLRFKTLDSMIGFYNVITEELDMPKDFPSSPFDNAGNLLRGWKKQVIPVLNVVSGDRIDTTLTAYIKDDLALVPKKEFQAGLHKT